MQLWLDIDLEEETCLDGVLSEPGQAISYSSQESHLINHPCWYLSTSPIQSYELEGIEETEELGQ